MPRFQTGNYKLNTHKYENSKQSIDTARLCFSSSSIFYCFLEIYKPSLLATLHFLLIVRYLLEKFSTNYKMLISLLFTAFFLSVIDLQQFNVKLQRCIGWDCEQC